MPEFQIFIPHLIPSKKNSKMMTRGMLITKPETQRILANVVMFMQLESRKQNISNLTNCEVLIKLYMNNLRSDADNALSSILDCLKNAGVLVNDSAKHVRVVRAEVVDCEAGAEGAAIAVIGEVLAEKKRRTA